MACCSIDASSANRMKISKEEQFNVNLKCKENHENKYYSNSMVQLHKTNRRSRQHETKSTVIWVTNILLPETRKNTFIFWPQHIGKWWPQMLADAGFVYLGTALSLQCFKCKVKTSVNDWNEKENPKQAHARLNPDCPYVKEMGFTPMIVGNQTTLNLSQEDEEIKQPGRIDSKKVEVVEQVDCNLAQQFPETKIGVNRKERGTKNGGRGEMNGLDTNLPAKAENLRIQNGDVSRFSDYKESRPKQSLQTVMDSMNSQLTINAANPRPQEPECKYPQYKMFNARKRSFGNWKFYQKQTPEALSKAGYFYTGENDIVRCFCCDLGLAEWDPKDDPWVEHARHNPRCWFLKNEKGQDFIQRIQDSWRKIYNPKHAAFDDKESRIATFDDWRTNIEQTPEILADAGFFYTGEEDIVRCHYCDGGLRHWETGDIPWEEHARWFPFCKFVIKMKGRQYIDEVKTKTEIYTPRHEAFADKESRIATFDDWRTDIEQTPEILADAGFFCTGVDNIVRCHYCDGGFSHWETGDIPWEDHARWFPFCKFLIKMKGRRYIDEVKTKTEERQRAAAHSENPNVHNNANYDVHHPILIKLKNNGIPESDIQNAVREFIGRNGNSNFNEEELIDLIFDKEYHRQQNRSVQNIVVERPKERDPDKLIEINRKMKEKMKCVRCRTNEICMLFVDCGHRLTCETCADKMDFCPICDTRIKKRLKTLLS